MDSLKALNAIKTKCYTVSKEIRDYPVPTYLHAKFLYLNRTGFGDFDFNCEPDDFGELYAYGLIIEKDENTFYLHTKQEKNIALLILLDDLEKSLLEFLTIYNKPENDNLNWTLDDPIFWSKYLMLNVDSYWD